MNKKLTKLIDQLDEIHAELPELLRDTGVTDAEYSKLWDVHQFVTDALSTMIFIQRNRK